MVPVLSFTVIMLKPRPRLNAIGRDSPTIRAVPETESTYGWFILSMHVKMGKEKIFSR